MPATISKTSDQQRFLEMMKVRDVRAMEILYDNYSSVLYGVIFWITREEKKAEDILFRTFTYIWNHFDTYDASVQNICFWMVNVARRFSFETLSHEERLLIINETQEFLQLKEHDKVLNLAFYKGMSIPKMAEKFGCTEIKIRKLLHEQFLESSGLFGKRLQPNTVRQF